MGMDERCQYVLSASFYQSLKATPLIFMQPFEFDMSKKQSRWWLVENHTMLNDTEISDLVYSHPNSSSFQYLVSKTETEFPLLLSIYFFQCSTVPGVCVDHH